MPSFSPVDDEKPTGKVWNGYVCPGCRSVFRVAAEFHGTDVICPSCHETLRLPKTPDEKQPLTISPVAVPSSATKPPRGSQAAAMQTQNGRETDQPTLRMMLSTNDGRIKAALAILVPLAVVVAVLLFEPWKKTAPSGDAAEISPSDSSEIVTPDEPVSPPPPPPPVAVNEMPRSAVTQTPPAVPEPLPEIVETAPLAPAPQPADVAADPAPGILPPLPVPALDEEELVAAIPADSKPLPVEKPQPAPALQAEVTPVPVPEPAPAPQATPETTTQAPELVHTVVPGDTLADISRAYQVGIPEIQQANSIRNDVIMPGQQLKIPGGIAPVPASAPTAETAAETPEPAEAAPRFHTVVRGDTLGRIARKYSVDMRAIMQANGMKNDVVRLGRKLVIPPP